MARWSKDERQRSSDPKWNAGRRLPGGEPARGSPFVNSDDTPFWRRKSLAEMTDSEWESLCDGCGRCCLVKLEDADDCSRTYFTDVGCRLLDGKTCRCRDYPNRTAKVKDCVRLTPRNIKRIVSWPLRMPKAARKHKQTPRR